MQHGVEVGGGWGGRSRGGPRAEPPSEDPRIARRTRSLGRGRRPESRKPIPNSKTVKSDDVMQAIPAVAGLGEAEVATPPEGPGACRCEFAQAPAVVLAAADIAAAVAAAPRLTVRVHLSRILQMEVGKDGGVWWREKRKEGVSTHLFSRMP